MAFGLPPWYTTVVTCLIAFVAKQRNSNLNEVYKFPDINLNDTYDFIIVGAGSAGSVVANRLSEVEDWSVLLIEAGGEEDAISDTPLLVTTLWNSEKDWNYSTIEQKNACRGSNGICSYNSGHVMGGGSTINVMNYVRGNKHNYDTWKNLGNDGWSYEDVLPYFKKSEDMRVEEYAESKYHSKGGYLSIEKSRYKSPIHEDLIKAGQELGYEFGDYNGEVQNRISYLQYTMRDGSRCSSSKAFLSPIKNRKNLHISKNTLALKLILNKNNNKVSGVRILRNGKVYTIKASKEVILSSGAINSPKLLMLSGIGSKDHLTELGINTKIDLPVGQQLFDHLMAFASFKVKNANTLTLKEITSIENMWDYASDKKGPLASSLAQVVGHFSFDVKSNITDVQIMLSTTSSFSNNQILKATIAKVQPKSVGKLKLRSSDPFDEPLIDPKYLEDKEDKDDMIKGCMLLIKLISTKSLSKYNPVISSEGTLCEGKQNEDYCDCIITNYSSSMFHTSGTAKMGKDGVVNSFLQVWNVDNLRIIDNSIMPRITSGNTNAPAMMIGEKGSDIIKRNWKIIT